MFFYTHRMANPTQYLIGEFNSKTKTLNIFLERKREDFSGYMIHESLVHICQLVNFEELEKFNSFNIFKDYIDSIISEVQIRFNNVL